MKLCQGKGGILMNNILHARKYCAGALAALAIMFCSGCIDNIEGDVRNFARYDARNDSFTFMKVYTNLCAPSSATAVLKHLGEVEDRFFSCRYRAVPGRGTCFNGLLYGKDHTPSVDLEGQSRDRGAVSCIRQRLQAAI